MGGSRKWSVLLTFSTMFIRGFTKFGIKVLQARIFLFIRVKKDGNSSDSFEDFGKSKKV